MIHQLCFSEVDGLAGTPSFNGTNYIEILKTLAPTFNETFHFCAFLDKKIDCNQFHSPILTDAGLCYTFNGLSAEEIYQTSEYIAVTYCFLLQEWLFKVFRLSEDFLLNKNQNATLNWNNEDGYLNDDLNTYPNRGFDASIKYGYTVLLQLLEDDFDYICRRSSQGFQVLKIELMFVDINKTFKYLGRST